MRLCAARGELYRLPLGAAARAVEEGRVFVNGADGCEEACRGGGGHDRVRG